MEKNTQNPIIKIEFGCSEKVKFVKYYSDTSHHENISDQNSTPDGDTYTLSLPELNNVENCVTIYVELDDAEEPILNSNLFTGKKLVGPVTFLNGQKYAWVRVLDDNIIKLLTNA